MVDLGRGLTAQSVVVGGFHTCVLLSNYQVKCWGSNELGQLGQGHTKHLGDNLDENNQSELGDNLAVVDLGRGLSVKAIAAGNDYNCVVLSGDRVKCWGHNSQWQLGQEHANHLGDGLGEDGQSELGDQLPPINL